MQVAKRYADALFEVALAEQQEEAVKGELAALVRVFDENPDLYKLLVSPALAKSEQGTIAAGIFEGRLSASVYNLLRLLIRNRRVALVRDLNKEYGNAYNEHFGIVEASVVSAVPLSETLQARLQQQLAEQTGKRVVVSYKVDDSIIGGLCIDMGSVRIDASVKHRLELLRRDIAATIA